MPTCADLWSAWLRLLDRQPLNGSLTPGWPLRAAPAPAAQRSPRKPPDRPGGVGRRARRRAVSASEGPRLRVGPAHLVSLNRRDTPPGNARQVRSGTVITGQCGLILLPPRCLEA